MLAKPKADGKASWRGALVQSFAVRCVLHTQEAHPPAAVYLRDAMKTEHTGENQILCSTGIVQCWTCPASHLPYILSKQLIFQVELSPNPNTACRKNTHLWHFLTWKIPDKWFTEPEQRNSSSLSPPKNNPNPSNQTLPKLCSSDETSFIYFC